MTLPSISIRRACLVSMIVLVIHTPLHEAGRVNRLPVMVMSDGDRFVIEGSAPPNITAWWPPSTWLFLMRYGPGPFHPTMPCESPLFEWQSEIHESMTADVALWSETQRRIACVGWPCTNTRSRTRLCATSDSAVLRARAVTETDDAVDLLRGARAAELEAGEPIVVRRQRRADG